MIVLDTFMYIYLEQKMKFLINLKFLKLKLRTKKIRKSKWFIVMEVVNISQLNLIIIVKNFKLFTKDQLHLLLNKMVWLKGSIGSS